MFQKNCIVLIYHRVTELKNDPQLLAVNPSNFEDQIKYLKENYNILSLKELIECLKKKKVPSKSVVITFDDGYLDNYNQAYPILKRYQVPATIFVSSGMISSNREFWWNELEYIFFEAEDIISKALELEIKGKFHRWFIRSSPGALKVYDDLHPLIKGLNIEAREAIMENLFRWAGKERIARPTHAVMDVAELKMLAQSNIIEIGAHTCLHPRLSNESCEVQTKEIEGSKLDLEKLLQNEVKSFSYPFGTSADFNSDSVGAVKKAGYICGIANNQGCVTNDTDPFTVPRMLVRNWTTSEFANNLKAFAKKPENMVNFITSKILR